MAWLHHVSTGASDLRKTVILNCVLICHLHTCTKEVKVLFVQWRCLPAYYINVFIFT